MIEVVKQPPKYCLVGNPVLIELKSDSGLSIPYSVQYGDKKVDLTAYPHKSVGGYFAKSDISDVLKSFFDEGLPIYGETISIAEYPEFIRRCSVTVDGKIFEVNAIDGGVSDDAMLELNETNDTMFSYRLMNAERSLLFTTRTNSPNLSLRESELFPFVFLHPGKAITFLSSSGNALAEKALPAGTPCLIDLAYVRKTFLEVHNELPAYIEIQVDGADSTYVTITKSEFSENLCWIVFKNSLGGYECIEITGKTTYTPELGESNSHQKYGDSGIFTRGRSRLTKQDIITVNSGYKNQQELDHMMDMLTTDKAYLVYPNKRIIEVIPVAENPKYDTRITTSTSIEFKLERVTTNKFHSPAIDLARPGAWIWDGIWDDYAYWFDGKQIKDFKE